MRWAVAPSSRDDYNSVTERIRYDGLMLIDGWISATARQIHTRAHAPRKRFGKTDGDKREMDLQQFLGKQS